MTLLDAHSIISPKSAQRSERRLRCVKCSLHGIHVNLKYHRKVCPYMDCLCEKCTASTTAQFRHRKRADETAIVSPLSDSRPQTAATVDWTPMDVDSSSWNATTTKMVPTAVVLAPPPPQQPQQQQQQPNGHPTERDLTLAALLSTPPSSSSSGFGHEGIATLSSPPPLFHALTLQPAPAANQPAEQFPNQRFAAFRSAAPMNVSHHQPQHQHQFPPSISFVAVPVATATSSAPTHWNTTNVPIMFGHPSATMSAHMPALSVVPHQPNGMPPQPPPQNPQPQRTLPSNPLPPQPQRPADRNYQVRMQILQNSVIRAYADLLRDLGTLEQQQQLQSGDRRLMGTRPVDAAAFGVRIG